MVRTNNHGRLSRFCWFLTRHNILTLLLILILTIIFLFGLTRIRGDLIVQDLLPYDHPYLKLHARFAEVFGSGGSGVAIAVKAKQGDIFNKDILSKVKKMTDEVQLWDEVYRVLTVSMASRSVKVVKALKKGEIAIQPLMWPDIPQNSHEMTLLKQHIFSDPAYNGVLVSRDGTAALILTELRENISYERAFTLFRNLSRDYSDEETSIHIIGFPMLMGWIYNLKAQTITIFLISGVLMVLILFIVFRNLLGMISPMFSAIVLTIIGLGFVGFIGINFSPLLYVLSFFVIARMISNSVQITCRYFEELQASGNDRVEACYQTMRTMLFPNWAGVATDIAGFLALGIAKIALMQHLAIIMSFWMLSIGLTSIMVPIVCSLIPLREVSERWAKERSKIDWQDRALIRLTSFSIGSGKYVVSALIIGLVIIASWQVSKIKIGDPTPGSSLLWPDHPYNKDQEVINKLFDASSENLTFYYEGAKESVYDPTVLTTFEAFERHMKKELPDITKSSASVINIVKMINLTFHDGDVVWYQLPQDRTMLGSLMAYVIENTERGTLNRFLDDAKERAQIILYFSDHTSENLLRIRDATYDFFKNHPMKTETGEFKFAGGRIGMEMAVNEEMIRSHAIIDTTVLVGILILISLSFMSIVAGLMITLPLIFANGLAFAYMALAKIGLTINTLPIAAVGVGVGDNFCIYLYSRCMEELPRQNGDWKQAIIQSTCTTGKAVVYTGLTIILPIITWYLFSDLKFQAQMGFFLSVIMGINIILALTLHPLLIYIIKPKFISKSLQTTGNVVEAEVIKV